jgi:hypothetical protein
VQGENIHVRHCPTAEMLADFLTKPLQGNLFRKFRNVLLGYQHVSTLQQHTNDTTSPEKRVEDQRKSMDPNMGNTKNQVEQSEGQVNVAPRVCTGETESDWTLVTPKKGVKNNGDKNT